VAKRGQAGGGTGGGASVRAADHQRGALPLLVEFSASLRVALSLVVEFSAIVAKHCRCS
jgi:hypothetical protein